MKETEGIDIQLYTELMSQIKKVNSDWISIRKSKQFRLGLVLIEIIQDIAHGNFSSLLKSVKRWMKGGTSRKIKSLINRKEQKNCCTNYFSSERIAVYTSIFGKYDQILEPYFVPNNCDFYIFTDQEVDSDSVWEKKEYTFQNWFSNADKNRFLKMNPHLLFASYKYSIYIDGNVQVIADLTEYINKLNNIGICIHNHNTRNCIYDELKAVIKTKRMTKNEAEKFKSYLMETNMPHNYGLLQCSVIVREHHNSTCIDVMESWWNLYSKFGKRDQLYLPLALFLHKIQVNQVAVLGDDLYSNPSFRIINHQK